MRANTANHCGSREKERESYTLEDRANKVSFVCGIKNNKVNIIKKAIRI